MYSKSRFPYYLAAGVAVLGGVAVAAAYYQHRKRLLAKKVKKAKNLPRSIVPVKSKAEPEKKEDEKAPDDVSPLEGPDPTHGTPDPCPSPIRRTANYQMVDGMRVSEPTVLQNGSYLYGGKGDDCKTPCTDDPDCTAYVLDKRDGTCMTTRMDPVGNAIVDSSYTTFLKQPFSGALPADLVPVDTEPVLDTIIDQSTEQMESDCQVKCLANPTCVAYSYPQDEGGSLSQGNCTLYSSNRRVPTGPLRHPLRSPACLCDKVQGPPCSCSN
jgi:hypothetical protein